MTVDEVIKLASQRFYQNSELRLETDFCIDAINECIDMIDSLCIAHDSDVGTEFLQQEITKNNYQVTIDGLKAVQYVLDLDNDELLDIIPIPVGKLLRNREGNPQCYYVLNNTIYIVPPADTLVEVGFWKDKKVLITSDEIPFNGLFDYAVVNYVVMKAKARDDENVNFEKFLIESFTNNVESILLSRKGSISELPLPFEI